MLSGKKQTSHVLHLILSCFTFGIWIFFWIIVAISNNGDNAAIDKKIKLGKKTT